MSIITYPLNGVVYSAEDVATYLCTRTSGVYSKETNFAVSNTGTRQITVAPGLAWINYDDFKGISVCSREENVLTVPEADNTLNRVDRVVLQFDTSENIAAIKLKTGTPAVAAQPPDILQNHNQYELGLCTISVPAGSTAVTAADITDTRADETVCGVMRDGVTGIPTAQLQTQAKAMLDSLQAEVDSRSFYTRAEVDALLKSVNPFPVGSIYQSTARTSPAALFGGTWQEIAQNRVLMGAGSGHAAGSTVEAGLPNITGSFVADVKKGEHKVSGAFTAGNVIASTGEYNSFSDVYKFSLDASKSNAIYGRSATVQPAAYYVHVWRRVA
nr:MAG TPA: Receptor Binding Protein [Caudoviricetes sp.]